MNEWYTVFCKPRGEKTAETNLEKLFFSTCWAK